MLETTGQGGEAVIALVTHMKWWRNKGCAKGTACGPGFLTDVHPSDGRLFASQVVLQGLVAGVCKLWFDTGGVFSGISESLWLVSCSCCMTTFPSRESEFQPCVTSMTWTQLSFLFLMRPWCAVASVLWDTVLTS